MNKQINILQKKLILASASPRRRELLTQIGLNFEIHPSDKEEKTQMITPWEKVAALSACKAQDIFDSLSESEKSNCLVLGADTLVAYGNDIMGKPKSEKQAEEMLTLLAGNTHQVYTGVTMLWLHDDEICQNTFYEKTDVSMYPMTREEITAYIHTKEPMDKAGAYAIQGKCAAYIKSISGDYNNVVGLPIGRICQELKNRKLEIVKE